MECNCLNYTTKGNLQKEVKKAHKVYISLIKQGEKILDNANSMIKINNLYI